MHEYTSFMLLAALYQHTCQTHHTLTAPQRAHTHSHVPALQGARERIQDLNLQHRHSVSLVGARPPLPSPPSQHASQPARAGRSGAIAASMPAMQLGPAHPPPRAHQNHGDGQHEQQEEEEVGVGGSGGSSSPSSASSPSTRSPSAATTSRHAAAGRASTALFPPPTLPAWGEAPPPPRSARSLSSCASLSTPVAALILESQRLIADLDLKCSLARDQMAKEDREQLQRMQRQAAGRAPLPSSAESGGNRASTRAHDGGDGNGSSGASLGGSGPPRRPAATVSIPGESLVGAGGAALGAYGPPRRSAIALSGASAADASGAGPLRGHGAQQNSMGTVVMFGGEDEGSTSGGWNGSTGRDEEAVKVRYSVQDSGGMTGPVPSSSPALRRQRAATQALAVSMLMGSRGSGGGVLSPGSTPLRHMAAQRRSGASQRQSMQSEGAPQHAPPRAMREVVWESSQGAQQQHSMQSAGTAAEQASQARREAMWESMETRRHQQEWEDSERLSDNEVRGGKLARVVGGGGGQKTIFSC